MPVVESPNEVKEAEMGLFIHAVHQFILIAAPAASIWLILASTANYFYLKWMKGSINGL